MGTANLDVLKLEYKFRSKRVGRYWGWKLESRAWGEGGRWNKGGQPRR